MAKTLRASNLVKSYDGRIVVNNLSFHLTTGEIVGLLGPNGAGKTTTFYMTVGLTRSDSGRVFLDDEDLTYMPMYKRARVGIGYLPQEPSIFRKLTVIENIIAILETLSYSGYEQKQLAEKLLGELGILHLSNKIALTLSGGEKRRLEIARALCTKPSFILLDEPFAGIDPIAVTDIQNIVLQLRSRGIGILITDHNVRETLGITNRAYILSDGKIIEEGTPAVIASSEKARNIYLGQNFSLK
ncbi:MAG TPA: LPS export ABC transporter ATP-binding protein [Nitrospinota bacterium]|nr:LPS export ABC transporter ATP-binding protein [Nitrospinota bacterium]|tara:strand:+ start:6423 stop:7151 length:729 start_codon:yes stop_codon:yes gene_type:complete